MGNVIPFAEELQEMYTSNRVEFAKIITKSVLSGLMALHDAGYIHRDIDPSNIMFTSDRHIKLIDFGIARKINSLSEDPSYKENIVGKPKYAAPELLSGNLDLQNQTTDLYTVGILLYQLLCGKLPSEGSMVDVIVMQKTKKIPVKDIQDEAMRQIVKKATEKQQSKRFQSASEFRVALDTPVPPAPTINVFVIAVAGLALLGTALGVLLGLFL
jgi:serine/threonine-protein kinase